MQPWHWKAAVALGAVAAIGLGAGRLAAQGRARSHSKVVRIPRPTPLSAQARSQKAISVSSTQSGLLLVLENNPGLEKTLDLDDNGTFQDNGDRVLRQGAIWLSNRHGDKLKNIGTYASDFTWLDVSGETDGTDLTQTTDLFFRNDGQARASGFWNVDDGAGDPALHIDGTTGRNSGLRRYNNGQFFFLDTLDDNNELWFLAR
jgi:hypothetical protein